MKLVKSLFFCALFTIAANSLNAFQLYCPGDYYLNCNDELWDLSIYGNAYYEAYGVYYDAGTPTVVFDLSSCNTGVIYRTWSVEDPYWNIVSCTQTLYVSGGSFGPSNITWPHQELQVYGCNTSIHPNNLPYGYDRPRYDYLTCSHIGVSYDDKVFNFGPDCKKVIRKWTLIDWCNYTPGSNYQGIWTYSQVIKISNTETPLLSCAKEIVVNALECDGSYVELEDVLIEGESCTGPYQITNNSQFALENGANASGRYPIGKTGVEYVVEYACGKEKSCRTDIIVKDNKPAVPYCYAGLNVSLMPQDTDGDGLTDDGMVEVWAEDLNVGSWHPCGNTPLIYSFSADVTDQARVFTCADVGTNSVQMWVTDSKGNQSYCIVNLDIQNNAANIPDCEPDEGKKYVLSGKVMDETGDVLEKVQLTLKDREPVYKYITEKDSFYNYEVIDSFYNAANVLVHIYDLTVRYEERVVDSTAFYNVMHLNTNGNGVYGTNDILLNRNYNISAYKYGDMSRVDNQDLEILKAFVEGNVEFKSPYSYIAADINEDRRIDQHDVDVLEELISGEEDEWPRERQWVFYNMSQMANMSANPLHDDLYQHVYIENIQNKSHHLDFMGVLKGDLDKHESLDELKRPSFVEKRSQGGTAVPLLFPNPFTTYLEVDNSDGEDDLHITIFDATGRRMLSSTIGAEARGILKPSPDWGNGIYLYRMRQGTRVTEGKLVKK